MTTPPTSPEKPAPERKEGKWNKVWKKWTEGEESDWWLASTGIPYVDPKNDTCKDWGNGALK